jgi:hypothetical protein
MICLIKESQLRNKKNIITRIKSHISIINNLCNQNSEIVYKAIFY